MSAIPCRNLFDYLKKMNDLTKGLVSYCTYHQNGWVEHVGNSIEVTNVCRAQFMRELTTEEIIWFFNGGDGRTCDELLKSRLIGDLLAYWDFREKTEITITRHKKMTPEELDALFNDGEPITDLKKQ